MEEGEVESLYLPVVKAIVLRLKIANQALLRLEAHHDNPSAIGDCEIAILQLRLICELLLLGSAAAHLHEGGREINDNKWRPKDSFNELRRLSEHPLQLPVKIELHKNGQGQHHIDPISQPLPFEALNEIYGRCGDLLHVPTIRQVVGRRIPVFDLDLVRKWLNGFRVIAMGHALMLPERETIMLCLWTGEEATEPEAFRLDGLGPSTLNISSYPEFKLLP